MKEFLLKEMKKWKKLQTNLKKVQKVFENFQFMVSF